MLADGLGGKGKCMAPWYRALLAFFIGAALLSSVGIGQANAAGYPGATLVLSNLPAATPRGREPLFSFSWGNGKEQLGLFLPEGDGAKEGPVSFDVGVDGTLAILDQVNSRVQIYSPGGTLRQSIRVPRTATHLRLTPTSIVVSEPWLTRTVLEYAFDGKEIGAASLPETIEWPTNLFEHNGLIYVEAENQLHALALPQRSSITTEQAVLPGRPTQNQPRLYHTVSDFEDDHRAVRFIRQGKAGIEQLKLVLADRHILQVQDHFSDQAGNVYVQVYLSESLGQASDPARNPEALLKLDQRGRILGAYLQSSVHFTDYQVRRFAVDGNGTVYQLEATLEGATIYQITFRPVGHHQLTQHRFADLPQGLIAPAPARVNTASPSTPLQSDTQLIDHTAAQPWTNAGGAPPTASGDVSILGYASGSYSGPPPMTRDQIIEIAQSGVSSPYKLGWESWDPFNRSYNGADCSGLISTAWQVNHTRPTREEATSRPSASMLLNNTTYWYGVDVNSRQKGDAFTSSSHSFLFEANVSGSTVWVYEALNSNYPIRHVTRDIGGYALRRRVNLDGNGIVGRDKGWIYGLFLDVYNNLGGESAVGHPFDNGGSILVHRWYQGYVQDMRGGWRGQGSLMHGDAVGASFLVHGAIYWTYMNMGGPGSWLGWPISNEESFYNGCSWTVRQRFQYGYITYNCQTGRWDPFGY